MNEDEGVEFRELDGSDADIGQHVGRLIEQAVAIRASDLFLTSHEREVRVAVRHLGEILRLETLSAGLGRRAMNYLKAMSGLDLTERRRPLDGRWIFQSDSAGRVDLRINTLPTLYGEDFTIRILCREIAVRGLGQLGMLHPQQAELTAAIGSPGGLILVTGPSGAGKTTTLYACLEHLNSRSRKINTIEDPVEYAIDGIHQAQVNPAIELDFPELLRSVLRQSPDVILVGEIRDSVTAQTAIRAANSGHLVLSTLHAPVAAAAVQSLLSLEVNPHFLSSSLRAILTQRLVRTLCEQCKVGYELDESPLSFAEVQALLAPHEGQRLYSAAGCRNCRYSGYVDRTGVFELLPVNRRLRELIGQCATTREIHEAAVADGMIELRRTGLVKVAQGATTVEELLRVIPAEHLGIED